MSVADIAPFAVMRSLPTHGLTGPSVMGGFQVVAPPDRGAAQPVEHEGIIAQTTLFDQRRQLVGNVLHRAGVTGRQSPDATVKIRLFKQRVGAAKVIAGTNDNPVAVELARAAADHGVHVPAVLIPARRIGRVDQHHLQAIECPGGDDCERDIAQAGGKGLDAAQHRAGRHDFDMHRLRAVCSPHPHHAASLHGFGDMGALAW